MIRREFVRTRGFVAASLRLGTAGNSSTDAIYLQPAGATARSRFYKAPFASLQSTHTFQEYQ